MNPIPFLWDYQAACEALATMQSEASEYGEAFNAAIIAHVAACDAYRNAFHAVDVASDAFDDADTDYSLLKASYSVSYASEVESKAYREAKDKRALAKRSVKAACDALTALEADLKAARKAQDDVLSAYNTAREAFNAHNAKGLV